MGKEIGNNQKKNALVLTGGGARSAYQVGVLRAISDITQYQKNPFQIISGFSAGAINGCWLASRHEDFASVTQEMWSEWAKVTTDQVFKNSSLSFASTALQWARDRGLGGIFPYFSKDQISYLLDTSPLYGFLSKNIDFDALRLNVHASGIYGVSLIAANYQTGVSTAFFSGSDKIKTWEGRKKVCIRTEIKAEHIMASSAIPVLFPPIQVGDAYYGDGMVRLTAPLSPSIHMGAERLLVIGVHGSSPHEEPAPETANKISLGEIAGTILNGMFHDPVETDLARLNKINRAISVLDPVEIAREPIAFRHIPVLELKPSKNLTASAGNELSQLPLAMRFILRGIGVTNDKGMDLLSYLAFEPTYMNSLLQLGYEDTMARKEEVLAFFQS